MNARAYEIALRLKADLGSLPGADSLSLHAQGKWALLLLMASSEEAVDSLGVELGLTEYEDRREEGWWWRIAAGEREGGAFRCVVAGPVHRGQPPTARAERMAAASVDGTPIPGPPHAAVLRALDAQTTPALIRKIRQYAEGRVKLMCRSGIPVSTTQARELVDDAYADTRIGVLPWAPDRCDLISHLRSVIKKRTWQEIRRMRRFSSVALHEMANGGEMPSQIEDALARSASADNHRDALTIVLSSVCRRLRRLVHHEREVSVLTRSWEDGLVDQDEILECTGLSRAGYARARKRALYMSTQLPAELREEVRNLLGAS